VQTVTRSGRSWLWHMWSGQQALVGKVLPAAGTADLAWEDPRREVLAYQTGMADALGPELRAPRCTDVVRRGDGSTVLLLEDVTPAPIQPWTLGRGADVARRLGRAQARRAVLPLPRHSWLNHCALSAFIGARGDEEFLLRGGHPLVPAELLAKTRTLWARPEGVLGAIGRLPQTLCHFDCHPGNLLPTRSGVVLADWECIGIGRIGEDPANLVGTAVLDLHLRSALLPSLYRTVVEQYHLGLAEEGWSGSRRDTQLAVGLLVVAKFAWVLPDLLRALTSGAQTLGGRPLQAAAGPWAAVATLVAHVASMLPLG
jgi:hypothetical protein